ncbi:MAG: bacteriohopanetetrol glucosamine biosynthesis glycosyltransferase HpnI [Caulobacteraceae bacterium]|nr:bacteriohopanetetrol glucosamine biosynthesis glycosyltransferase HpnI [Caulobacteraceae bacterium]
MNLSHILDGAGIAVLSLAACGAIYACLATWALWRFLKRPAGAPVGRPSVLVLKPLHGDEPGLQENLNSFCALDYAGPVRMVLGAQDPADAALDVARKVQRDNAGRDIVVVSDSRVHGTNRKIGNLINMSASGAGEVVVISDSDVRLPPEALSRIVAALEQPGVGLVYCLYRGRPTKSIWSQLAAMDVNTRFAPSVVVGQALGAHPVLGPTMALRAEVLEQIGGLEHLADFLADDFELGRAVRAAGYTIACPTLVIDHVFPERSLREMLAHEMRWSRTVRLVQPAGYLGSVIMHVLPLTLIGAALTGFSAESLAVLAAMTVFRLIQARMLNGMMGADNRLWWLVPARDLLSFAVFVGAIFGDRVEWRGNRLQVGRDGAIAAT